MQENSPAVLIQNACKSYGHQKDILINLCMRVERGSIYGLLGASGCGKTTLLSSIVGRKRLDSGDLWVLGGKPGTKGSGVPGPRVGYMPQDLALVAEFTVKDAVYYFGTILGMDQDLLRERFTSLSKLLELPPEDKYIKNCSGGQQRRVSFAAAMVHMPELLILDEPTVGLDPVLRDRIWNFLVDITVKENMAVIITTHYIEETRQAHKIGLMRGGKLLAEESPQKLLTLFQTDSLEDVFLTLSKRQEEGRLDELASLADDQNNSVLPSNANSTTSIATFDVAHGSTDILTQKSKPKKPVRTPALDVDCKRVKALFIKNWKQFYRNITGLVFLMSFPIIQSVSFFLAVGGDIKSINLAIVNDETMSISCPNYTTNGSAVPYSFSSCHFNQLSCRFLTYLDNPMINKVLYEDVELAKEGVKHGNVVGVVYMAKNFTESLEERSNMGKDTSEEALDYSEIKVWMDMSNRQIGQTLKYRLQKLYLDFQKQVFTDCKFLPKLAEMPLNLDYVFGDQDETYTIFMMPGILVTLIFFMGAILTSQIIITDRCEGVWDRSIVAGVTSLEITLTHFSLQACIVLIQSIELMFVTFCIFQMEYQGNIALIWLILYIMGICGMSYGFWISVISVNHSMANIVTTGSFVPMILTCGLIWPLEGMPLFLNYLSKCLPFTIAIDSVRNVIKKAWPASDFQVWNGMLIGIVWTIAFICISLFLIKKKR